MSIWLFWILLIIVGGWCITDGWFSLSLYLKDPRQTWYRDHYIRVIRIIGGFVLWYMAFIFFREIILHAAGIVY
jgi:hypothetical protein